MIINAHFGMAESPYESVGLFRLRFSAPDVIYTGRGL